MRVLFVWTGVTGYMGDCWRALQRRLDGSLRIVVVAHPSGVSFDTSRVLRDLDVRIVPAETRDLADEERPDILFAVGWHAPLVRRLVTRADWAEVPKICCFDLPWNASPRRIAARWILRPFLRHYAAAYVPGCLAARYARWLRFPDVRTGLFSTDLKRFPSREHGGDGFLFVGRYEPEKGLHELIDAYARYREMGGRWSLTCVGAGSLGILIKNRPGVRDLGFLQPEQLGEVYSRAGAFVLPSRAEPWGVVLAEAAGAGLPLVVSSACGARHELVRGNGVVFRAGSVPELAAALLKVSNSPEVQQDGVRLGPALAAPYDKDAWAERTLGVIKEYAPLTPR